VRQPPCITTSLSGALVLSCAAAAAPAFGVVVHSTVPALGPAFAWGVRSDPDRCGHRRRPLARAAFDRAAGGVHGHHSGAGCVHARPAGSERGRPASPRDDRWVLRVRAVLFHREYHGPRAGKCPRLEGDTARCTPGYEAASAKSGCSRRRLSAIAVPCAASARAVASANDAAMPSLGLACASVRNDARTAESSGEACPAQLVLDRGAIQEEARLMSSKPPRYVGRRLEAVGRRPRPRSHRASHV